MRTRWFAIGAGCLLGLALALVAVTGSGGQIAAGLVGALAVAAAPWPASGHRWRAPWPAGGRRWPALALVVVGTAPIVALTWWSIVTPLLAAAGLLPVLLAAGGQVSLRPGRATR